MNGDRSKIMKRLTAMRGAADACERPSVPQRRTRLKKLLSLVVEYRQAAITALRDDLGKSAFESCATEILPLVDILRYLIRKLPKLAHPRGAGVSWMNFPADGALVPEPYGLVLVVATWNYPLLLALEPLAGAFAAGNQVVLKLHDRALHTNGFLRWLIHEAFGDEVLVVDNEIGFPELIREKFDYIFYTGNGQGGREVLTAAAGNLTPATLELGGKSPCIVAPGANLKVAARRIVWGKFTNCGQTCVAPDYLLVHTTVRDALVEQLKRAVREFYGASPLDSPDYGHMIDVRAYERVSKLVGSGRLICGGDKQPERLAIEPTIVDRLNADDPLLSEEIFGPVLPVVTYDSEDALFAELRRRGKPLALYCFGGNRKLRSRLVSGSSSGALVFNDVVTHFVNPKMPFGGVGPSGMGAYHGRRTFETFSHFKPVMKQSRWFGMPFRYPPFSKFRTWFLELLIRF